MPAPPPEPSHPVTVLDFARWKASQRPIAMLTAYDFPTARLLDQAGVDSLLVGDSLGTVVQGRATTLGVTLDQMVYHAEMVSRAARRALVIADMPFGSYQVSCAQAVQSAVRLMQESGCAAVKLEGGRRMADRIQAIRAADIPVVGHIGLTPQSFHHLGGYKVQRDAEALRADAAAVAQAGAFALVLECVPGELAARITAEVPIPTIGIGAGNRCDGQVLVVHDMLGLIDTFAPRFVRRYASLAEATQAAARQYVADVSSGAFPSTSETYS